MAKRKKKRTQIRTASGVLQEKLFQRIETLLEDPTVILPEFLDEEPKAYQKIRAKLEKLRDTRKPSFFDKKDKGLVGAIANAYPILEQEAIPRVADFKVAGKRRFFLQRGMVNRGVTIGVQNYDDPLVLLIAYVESAKEEGLHFLAADKLYCTGKTVQFPQPWLDAIAEGIELEGEQTWGIPAETRIVFEFEGATLALPAKRKNNWNGAIGTRYRGPKQRQPFGIMVEVNGERFEPDREVVAGYRGGIQDDAALVRSTAHKL